MRKIPVSSKMAVSNFFTNFYQGIFKKYLVKLLTTFQIKKQNHIIFMEKFHAFELSGFVLVTSTKIWTRRAMIGNTRLRGTLLKKTSKESRRDTKHCSLILE